MKKMYLLIIIIIILTGCKTVVENKEGLISQSSMERLYIEFYSTYSNWDLETRVIHSEKEFQEYIPFLETLSSTRKERDFINDLQHMDINFNSMNFLIFSQACSSPRVRYYPYPPVWEGENALIFMNRIDHGGVLAVMAYQVFTYKVSKEIPKIILDYIQKGYGHKRKEINNR